MAQLLIDAVLPQVHPDSWLGSLLQAFSAGSASSATIKCGMTGCLLADTGDLLVLFTRLASQLAHQLVYGEHVYKYTQQREQAMSERHDFSEFEEIDYMDDKLHYLKLIAIHIEELACKVDGTWKESPSSCFEAKILRPPIPMPLMATAMAFPRQPGYPAQPIPYRLSNINNPALPGGRSDTVATDTPDFASSQNQAEDLYPNLASRGKGQYVCLHGKDCTKGGLLDNDELRVFEQNSSYKKHMQKHERPFKCNFLNCPNREGFARKDQLERHQKKVGHNIF